MLSPTPGKVVRVADGRRVSCMGKGRIGSFCNVHYCPGLQVNLLSVSKLVEDGFTVGFGPGICKLTNASESHVARLQNGLYLL